MKDILKKIIVILVIVSIVLIISVVMLKNIDEGNNANNDIISETEEKANSIELIEEDPSTFKVSEEIKKEKTESVFYMMTKCINKYYHSIEIQDKKQVYGLLSKKYIDDNNINETNLFNILPKLVNGFESFRVEKIYNKNVGTKGKCDYYVLGNILTENYSALNKIYVIVSVDSVNNSFSITPTNMKVENNNQYAQAIQNSQNTDTSDIELSEYNEYNLKTLQTTEILQFYLSDYATMALYYPELAYNILDEEYRSKRFGSIEEYKIHIKLNESKFLLLMPIKYGFAQKGDRRQYTIIDNYNNTYVLEIGDAMEYRVIADTYTVDLDPIIEKYDEESNEYKVQVNIQKIVEALNNKDYKYVYSKLSEDFRVNKYSSIEDIQKDIMIYGSCFVVFEDYEENGDNHIYDIELRGNTVSSSNFKMRITMQLKDKRDYTFEFELIKEQEKS